MGNFLFFFLLLLSRVKGKIKFRQQMKMVLRINYNCILDRNGWQSLPALNLCLFIILGSERGTPYSDGSSYFDQPPLFGKNRGCVVSLCLDF
jgi:hypothetical protein